MEYSDDILQLIESYLRNSISELDLNKLTQLLNSDLELAAQVKEFKEVIDVLDEDSWSITDFDKSNSRGQEYFKFYANPKNKAYLSQLENIDLSSSTNKEGANRKKLYGLLVVAAILVISFFIFNPFKGSDDLIAFNYDEIPTLTVRGQSKLDSINSLIDGNFKKKDYKAVTKVISENQHIFTPDQLDLIHIYKGVSFTEQGLFDEAHSTLSNKEVFSNSIYEQMAEWYLSMSLIRDNKANEAKKLLTKMSKDSNHYKQIEAKKILRSINKRDN